jgi:ActR/RegA family two-component response regulator
MPKPLIMCVVEIGGYPNFGPLYERAGYEVAVENRMRKAMSAIRKRKPQIIVAEFNFQSDFRDRTSSLESMMSVVERLPDTRVIVFYEREYAHQFARLQAIHQFHRTFAYPIPEDELAACVAALNDGDT